MGRRERSGRDGGRRPPRTPRHVAEDLSLAAAWLWTATAGVPLCAILPDGWGFASSSVPFLLGGWVFFTSERRAARLIGAAAFVAGCAGHLFVLMRMWEG